MANKFQEALDYLDRRTLTKRDDGLEIHEEQVKTLQELIDEYISQEEAHKEAMKEMAECIECFEKALDKACGLLARQSSCYACQLKECIRKEDEFVCTMDEWRELILKDE